MSQNTGSTNFPGTTPSTGQELEAARRDPEPARAPPQVSRKLRKSTAEKLPKPPARQRTT